MTYCTLYYTLYVHHTVVKVRLVKQELTILLSDNSDWKLTKARNKILYLFCKFSRKDDVWTVLYSREKIQTEKSVYVIVRSSKNLLFPFIAKLLSNCTIFLLLYLYRWCRTRPFLLYYCVKAFRGNLINTVIRKTHKCAKLPQRKNTDTFLTAAKYWSL